MKRLKTILILCGLALTASGCAHNHKVEGAQKEMELPKGYKVAIGSKEVTEDEIVDVFAPKCHEIMGGRGQKRKECHTTKIGEAKVLKLVDTKSAIIEPLDGLIINSEMSVEKKQERQVWPK